jgi:FkbM family methyltransferase
MIKTEKVKGKHGDFYIIDKDMFISRSLKEYGEWGEGEMEVYNACIQPKTAVIEVGSHIGSLTVPISKLCHCVFSFEPQRTVFQLLNTNLRINNIDNVYTYMNPVGNENKMVILKEVEYGFPINSGAIKLEQLQSNDTNGYPAPMVRLDDFIPSDVKVSFIKVDAETMEIEVIKGADKTIKKNRPILYLESHLKSNQVLENYVRDLGYKVYAHTPRGFNPDNFNKNPNPFLAPDIDGIYDFMILCVPNEMPFNTNLRLIS